jgi:luciferase family oxidoreductase group 1
MSLDISVLDQSPVLASPSGAGGLVLTVELAKAAEEWGYKRYWVAEHHGSDAYAGTAPEILVGHLASQTNTIRVGSGGVMLPHYSPYKVAEKFGMLATLYPRRIDLGIGRASGTDGLGSHALAYPYQPLHEDSYPQQALLLKGFIDQSIPASHPYARLKVMPAGVPKPEMWMLGSSGGSAELAGSLGYKMALALFIGPQERPVSIVDDYENAWRAAGHEGDPEVMIVTACFCADTREEAKMITATQAYWKVFAFLYGRMVPFFPPDEVSALYKKLSPSEQEYFDMTRESGIYGTPDECLERLQQLSIKYRANELGIVTVTYDQASRLKSYRLIAEK